MVVPEAMLCGEKGAGPMDIRRQGDCRSISLGNSSVLASGLYRHGSCAQTMLCEARVLITQTREKRSALLRRGNITWSGRATPGSVGGPTDQGPEGPSPVTRDMESRTI